MLPGRNLRIERRRMALTASRGIGFCFLMRIVTSQACHAAVALQKTLRFPKPVSGAPYDFEFIVVPDTGSMVESQQKIAERLARPERKWPTIEAPH